MNRYREYHNLYQVYRRMLRKNLIAFLIHTVLCVVFFFLIVFDMPIELMYDVWSGDMFFRRNCRRNPLLGAWSSDGEAIVCI